MSQEQQQTDQDEAFAKHGRTTQLLDRAMGGEDVTADVPESHREQFAKILAERQGEKISDSGQQTEKHPSDMNEAELEAFVATTIPFQYRGLPAESLEIVWSVDDVPYFADDPSGERRQAEIQKRALALTALESFLPEARKRSIHQRLTEVGRKVQIASIRQGLGEETFQVKTPETLEGVLSSQSLDELQTHHFESAETGVSVLHTNKEHGQDAFAVNAKEGVACVSDGASSYGKSGVVSAEFSKALAEDAVSGKPFSEIFSETNIRALAVKVKESDAFKKFNSDENPHAKGSNKEAGLATTLLTRKLKDGSIEWASVGDSPLMVLDRNPDGSYSFEIVNDNVDGTKFTDKNFTDPKMAEALATPETQLIGIGRDGEPRLQDLKHMQQGKIEYREGRVVILASDFLTKMMALSQPMMEAKRQRALIEGKLALADAWQKYLGMADSFNNPLAGKQFKPELLFDGTLSSEDLKRLVDEWKTIETNSRGLDDMTAVCIKMSAETAN